MDFHPVANIFPMMSAEEYEKLKVDIALHGQREPIWTHEGQIVDGRNRYNACVAIGKEPIMKEWDGQGSLLEFVMSLNMHRRHLTASQKAVVALGVERIQAEEAKERQRIAGTLYGENHSQKEVPPILAEPLIATGDARDKAAEIMGVSHGYISDAKRIERDAPELIEPLLAGKINIPMAKILMDFEPEEREEIIAQGEVEVKDSYKRIREKIEQEKKKKERAAYIEQQKEDIANGVAVLPAGVFEVITIDPPWAYGTPYDPNGRRVSNPYPEMAQTELLKLEIPAADDSVLFLWTTQKFIWDAKELLDYWGFTYRATLVWDKEMIGMGDLFRMQCEFCLVGLKGSPLIHNNHTWRDIFREQRREHSRKPEFFYGMVDEMFVGRKLDYFSRAPRNGWECFGNEVQKFND